jgi:hypothetical protein
LALSQAPSWHRASRLPGILSATVPAVLVVLVVAIISKTKKAHSPGRFRPGEPAPSSFYFSSNPFAQDDG